MWLLEVKYSAIFRGAVSVREVRRLISLFNGFSRGVGSVRGECGIIVAGHNDRVGIRNSPGSILVTIEAIRYLVRVVGGNRRVGRRGVRCTSALMHSNRSSGVNGLLGDSYIYVASGKGPMGTGALKRGGCVRTVGGGAVAVNINPTNANGACLTMTMTITTFHTGRMGQVVLAHPTIRTNRDLNFLPNSLRRGVSPCLHPLCSTLFRVLNTRGFRQYVRHNSVRITPLTCVHNEALSSDFVVLSRTRGAADRRVGVFLAHLNFGSGTIIANSVARVSLPDNGGSKLGSTIGVLGGVSSVTVVQLSSGSIMERHLIRRVVGTCREGRRRGRHGG